MRRLAVFLTGVVALGLVLSGPLRGAGASPRRTARTFMVAYNYTYDAAALDRMARDFDLIVWGNPPEHFRECARTVKQKNPRIVNLFYRDLQAMHDYYADWKEVAKHPDWFLKDVSGTSRLVHREWKWRAMDLSHSGWTDHLISDICRELQACPAWDGVFVDDVWTAFRDEFVRETDQKAAAPATGCVENFFRHTRIVIARLKQAVGQRAVIVNEDFVHGDYLGHCDGALMEIFVHSSLFDTLKVDRWYWKLSLDLLEKSGHRRKLFLANSMIKPGASLEETQRVQRFCYATYLLGMHSSSYYSFHSSYDVMPVLEEWSLDLGAPLGKCFVKDRVYFRKFAKGLVVVNPEQAAASVTLGGSWRAWGKERVTHLDMAPQSGVVLVR